MSKIDQSFIAAVTNSRVLSREQKQDFTEAAASLPDDYKADIIAALSEFDVHSKDREEYLKKKLRSIYGDFSRKMKQEAIPESERRRILAQARKQTEDMFPKDDSDV